MTTVLIDNYDSFTWNVYQFLSELGAQVLVFRNDQATLQELIELNPRNLVISPGPGHPRDAKISLEAIRYFSGKIPILGVCLGEQCMFEVFGGVVTYAGEIVHGKTSPIQHDGMGIYKGLPQNIQVTRYHSLAGNPQTLPESLEITSTTLNGIVMGIRHKKYIVEGVQYHPESISSEFGKQMFANFLRFNGGTWDSMQSSDAISITTKEKQQPTDIPTHGLDINLLSRLNSTSINQSILEKICQQRRIDVDATKALPGNSFEQLQRNYQLGLAPKVVNLYEKLQSDQLSVMAEVKRASPSKSDICIEANAPSQAIEYALGGASVISVLTEPKWFKGSMQDLSLVRRALDKLSSSRLAPEQMPSRPAVLCKDFIFSEYQILEARLAGADSCLLIAACISSNRELLKLMQYSRSLGMEPLVEVANVNETKRAVECGALVIGINNRDLHTFSIDSSRTVELSALIPDSVIVAALSGISTFKDVERYQKAGARAVLVGEALMKTPDKHMFIKYLQGQNSVKRLYTPKLNFKICGITRKEDAIYAKECGAMMIGLIFAASPRQVSVEKAAEISQTIRNQSNSLVLTWDLYSKPNWFTNAFNYIFDFQQRASRPLVVGVFSNQTPFEINRIVDQVGLDLVQLHGNEDSSISRLIKVPCIKAIHVMPDQPFDKLLSQVERCIGNCLVLLDTGIKYVDQQGGSGKTFDWSLANRVSKAIGDKVMVAGGFNPENVAQGIKVIGSEHLFAVDCSSGVEDSPGVKSSMKMVSFADKVRPELFLLKNKVG